MRSDDTFGADMDGCVGGYTVHFIVFNKLGDCGRFIGKDERPTPACHCEARAGRSNVQHRPSEINKKFHGVKMMNEKTNFEQLMLIEK